MTTCPICKKGTLHPYEGTEAHLGITIDVTGQRCDACGEILYDAAEVKRQERAFADGVIARGVRTADEFKWVRKSAGLRANEVAELLDVRPETVSRWERGEVEIPRTVAFALGELYDRPRVTRDKLEAFARAAP